MSSSGLPPTLARFGTFELDANAGQLFRKGIRVKLQDQPFRILCMLIDRPGQVISREEIRQALWPEGTFVDFDAGLNAAIKKLRAAIDDDSSNPRFIETVPKRGYRFVAPVDRSIGGVSGENIDRSSGHEQRDFSSERRLGASPQLGRSRGAVYTRIIALCFISAVLVWQISYWSFPAPQPRIVSRKRITVSGDVEPGPIVTDGRRVFYQTRRGGRTFPMMAPLIGGESQVVETPFLNSMILDVSSDGTEVLLSSFASKEDAPSLWINSFEGTAPYRVGNASCGDAKWSPDQLNIICSLDGTLSLWKRDGTKVRDLVHFDTVLHSVTWREPDGPIRFTSYDPLLNFHAIWEIRPDGSGLQRIFPANKKSAELLNLGWFSRAQYYLFAEKDGEHWSLETVRSGRSWWHRTGNRSFVLANTQNDSVRESAIPVGKSSILARTDRPGITLMRVKPQSDELEILPRFSNAANLHFSRRGDWVLYVAQERSGNVLRRCRPDGTECLSLASRSEVLLEPRWSPDGKNVLFIAGDEGHPRHLYVVPVDGSSEPKLLTPDGRWSGLGDWSPDGRKIVVALNSEGRDSETSLYLVDVTSGDLSELPQTRGLRDPAWSLDGAWIAAVHSDGHQIAFLDTGKQKWVAGPKGNVLGYMYWSRKGADLFLQDVGLPNQPVYRLNVRSGNKQIYYDFTQVLGTKVRTCRLNGIGPDDSLYVTGITGESDLVQFEVELP